MQALDAGTASVLPEGLRAELEQLEDAGGVRHLQDLKEQIQASFFIKKFYCSLSGHVQPPCWLEQFEASLLQYVYR